MARKLIIAYIAAIVTMLVGAAVLGERITWMALAGVAILIAGMYKTVSGKLAKGQR